MSDQAAVPRCETTEGKCPSEEFRAYCEAEFERRLNSGDGFDEAHYRAAMEMAADKLRRLETEGAA